jgi:hypothetical protein
VSPAQVLRRSVGRHDAEPQRLQLQYGHTGVEHQRGNPRTAGPWGDRISVLLLLCIVVWCVVVYFRKAWYGLVWSGVALCVGVWHGMMWWYGVALYSTVLVAYHSAILCCGAVVCFKVCTWLLPNHNAGAVRDVRLLRRESRALWWADT